MLKLKITCLRIILGFAVSMSASFAQSPAQQVTIPGYSNSGSSSANSPPPPNGFMPPSQGSEIRSRGQEPASDSAASNSRVAPQGPGVVNSSLTSQTSPTTDMTSTPIQSQLSPTNQMNNMPTHSNQVTTKPMLNTPMQPQTQVTQPIH